jgi:undecaprenyl-diphosphatase
LFKPVPVAIAFIAGGLIILWAERRKHKVTVEAVDDMTWKHALMVGAAQCLALIPGTSRAGSTIIGGLFFGLSRRAATEFSFFLAVPVLFAASGYELFKNRALFSSGDLGCSESDLPPPFVRRSSVCAGLPATSAGTITAFARYRIAFDDLCW